MSGSLRGELYLETHRHIPALHPSRVDRLLEETRRVDPQVQIVNGAVVGAVEDVPTFAYPQVEYRSPSVVGRNWLHVATWPLLGSPRKVHFCSRYRALVHRRPYLNVELDDKRFLVCAVWISFLGLGFSEPS